MNKIPMNFDWRAAMNVQQPSNNGYKGFDPFDPAFNPLFPAPPKNFPHSKNKSSMEFNQSMLQHLDTKVTDILEKYSKIGVNNNNWNQLKHEIKIECDKVKKKYDTWIDHDTVRALYCACLNQYTNDWIMHLNGKSPSDTEYSVDISDGKLYMNPFVIYKIFTTDEIIRNVNE